jgi:hypothetical protein
MAAASSRSSARCSIDTRRRNGGITSPPDAPLPKKIVRALVCARLAEIAEKQRAPKTAKTTTAAAARKPAAPMVAPGKAALVRDVVCERVPVLRAEGREEGPDPAGGRRGDRMAHRLSWQVPSAYIHDEVDLERLFGAAPGCSPKAVLIKASFVGCASKTSPIR